ncbi:MAG: hypothetical protein WBX26_09705 [Candidatus Cybelea sp.]
MTLPQLSRSVLSAAAGIALFAGCAGSQTDGDNSGAASQVLPASRGFGFRQSWMDPGAAGHDLLYVTNADGVVNVYRYWQHTLVGVLTSFSQPEGECADGAGNVYIADYAAKKVFEYAHGGKSTIETFDTSPYAPFGCAVNTRNGDLAVANYYNYHQRGNIEIYRRAKGKPVIYTYPYVTGFRSVGYDNKGNLLATDGNGYSSSYFGSDFAYLPKSGIKLIGMAFCYGTSCGGSWTSVQGIQWDGKYWVFNTYNDLFRWTIANNKSQYVDEIQLNGAYEDEMGPFWLYRQSSKATVTQVVGSSSFESRGAVFYWKYPAGGDAVDSVTKNLDAPFGVAVSLKP